MTIFSMNQPASFYFKSGKFFIRNQEWYDGLLYLNKAVYLEPSEEHIKALANAYSRIGYSSECIPLFFKLLKKTNKQIYKNKIEKEARSRYYNLLRNQELVIHLLFDPNIATEKLDKILDAVTTWKSIEKAKFYEKSWTEELFDLIDIMEFVSESYENTDIDSILSAKNAMLNKEFELASSFCFEVKESSDFYEVAMQILSLIAELNNQYELTIFSITELRNINSIYATIILLNALQKGRIILDSSILRIFSPDLKEKELSLLDAPQIEKTRKNSILDSLLLEEMEKLFNSKIPDNLAILSVALRAFGYSEHAKMASKYAYLLEPMEEKYIYNYVKMLIINGDYNMSKIIVEKNIQIFPNDSFLILFNWLLKEKFFPNKLELFSDKFWAFVINKLMLAYRLEFSNNCIKANGDLVLTKRVYEIMDVVFSLKLYTPIVEVLVSNRNNKEEVYQDYLLQLLENIEINDEIKSVICYSLLLSKREINIFLNAFINYRLRQIRIRNFDFSQKSYPGERQHIYASVSTHLLFMEEKTNPEFLKKIVDEIMDNKNNLRSLGGLSAIVTYFYLTKNKDASFIPTYKELASIFRTSVVTIEKYMKYYLTI